MKKNTRTKLCGALLVASGFAALIWTAVKVCDDNLAHHETKATISEKQAFIKEFCPTNPKYVALGFFDAITAIGGCGLLNKSKEK